MLSQKISNFVALVASEIKKLKAEIETLKKSNGSSGTPSGESGGGNSEIDPGVFAEEVIFVDKSYWNSNGYPFTNVIKFENTYKNPVVFTTSARDKVSTKFASLVVYDVTPNSCKLRSGGGVQYEDIESGSLKIYIQVKEVG